ncbi:MAG: 30S ribosome-binding factor RbfA [candidate division Zixibacteria bacterium]|nr:30S ribosome-binding factor RbfA [candidate division Zixibacteria bacterium]
MQYQRKDRVGDLIKREIAHIIQSELKDPGIGFVTITGVEVSVDLKQAKVFYSVLGDEDSKRESTSALRRASGFIQHEIGKKLKLKYTPEIFFQFDTSVEYGAHIEELIQKIHRNEGPDQNELDQDEPPEDHSALNEDAEDK